MKVKFLGLMLVMASLATSANAQFNHSAGASLIYGKGKIPAGAEAGSEAPTILGYGIFYYPRYNLTETETGALSIGVPLSAALSGSVNSREGGSISILADLPITLDYNFGAGSTVDNEAGFGGFLGAGFSYTYSNYTEEFYIPGVASSYEQIKGSTYGPLVHGGIKAYIGEKTYFLRGFYKMGLEKAKFKTFGVAVGICL
jgi:hypothetical protein